MSEAAFIGIDWGTTNLRGWQIDAVGQALDARASAEGMGGLMPDGFAPALARLVEGWPGLPVLACGMVGARQGWVEAAYVTAPATAGSLARSLMAVPGRDDVRIVPGVAMRSGDGRLIDVMRGEETQAIGIDADRPALLICPGTHGKWIEVDHGEIGRFQTFMTGEMNAVLARQSVLRHSVGGDAEIGPVFIDAVQEMLAGTALAAALFSVRVGTLDGRLSPVDAASRLSGLLIGAEVAAGMAKFGRRPITLIGAPGLTAFYATALAQADCTEVQVHDGAQAVCLGLARIWRSRP